MENNGIPVLVIPGITIVNNHQAARYKGEERLPAEYTTRAEFSQIYRAFGYDEAASEGSKQFGVICMNWMKIPGS